MTADTDTSPVELLLRYSHDWKASSSWHEMLIRPVCQTDVTAFPSCELTVWTWPGLDQQDHRPAAGEALVLSGDPAKLLQTGPAHDLELAVGINSYPDEAALQAHLSLLFSQLTGQTITPVLTADLTPFYDHPRARFLTRLAAVTAHLPTGIDAEGNAYLDLEGPALQAAQQALLELFQDEDSGLSTEPESTDSRNSDSRNSDSRNSDSRNSDSRNSDSRNSDSRNSDSRNSDSRNSDSRNSDSSAPHLPN